MIVYNGSHEIMRKAFAVRLESIPSNRWRAEDVTEAYTDARRLVFERGDRVEVHARPGEAYLVHRLALHRGAPWRYGTVPRSIAYFRPDTWLETSPEKWLYEP